MTARSRCSTLTGSLIGVLVDAEFDQVSVELLPGDVLILYTDGVTESRREHDLFGEERPRRGPRAPRELRAGRDPRRDPRGRDRVRRRRAAGRHRTAGGAARAAGAQVNIAATTGRSERSRMDDADRGRGALLEAKPSAVGGVRRREIRDAVRPEQARRRRRRARPRWRSTMRAAWRPSLIAQTISDWPRRASPAAKTPGTEVA